MSVETALVSPMEISAERMRRKFSLFFRRSWHVLEPGTPLADNWHVDALCDHFQAAIEDWAARKLSPDEIQARFQNLLINVPPGTAKSRIISVHGPAWVWLRFPSWKVICISGNPRVALRDADYSRLLITSEWYQAHFKPTWKLEEDINSKSNYMNTSGGQRLSFGITSQITGDRADALIVDDPNDAEETVKSKVHRDSVNDRWDSAIANRVNDLRCSVRIGIMQRLHAEDWSGHVLAHGGWEHLCLPMEFDPKRACKTKLPWADPRTEPDELLFPKRFPRHVVDSEKKRLRSAASGQLQQDPVAAEGNLVQRKWLAHRWRRPDQMALESMETRILPTKWDELVLILDAAFKDTEQSDLVCLGAMARSGVDKYLLELVWDRMDFISTVAATLDMYNGCRKRWGRGPDAVLIEDKANGTAVINVLKKKVPRVKEVSPGKDSKTSRLLSVTGEMECGNYWIPLDGDKIGAYVEELVGFPKAAHDDAVDMTSYGLNRLSMTSAAAKFEALGNYKNLRVR